MPSMRWCVAREDRERLINDAMGYRKMSSEGPRTGRADGAAAEAYKAQRVIRRRNSARIGNWQAGASKAQRALSVHQMEGGVLPFLPLVISPRVLTLQALVETRHRKKTVPSAQTVPQPGMAVPMKQMVIGILVVFAPCGCWCHRSCSPSMSASRRSSPSSELYRTITAPGLHTKLPSADRAPLR